MNREEARQYIINHSTDHLKPDRSKRGYICPICGSGNGKNGTGITTKDKVHFTCWAGCFTNSDIIDIIGQENGLTDYNDKLHKAADVFNITIKRGNSGMNARENFAAATEYQKQNKIKQNTQQRPHNNTNTATQPEAEPDYTDFFLQANKDIEKTSYHRGLTLETLNRFNVGYVESWKHPKAPKMKASPRLIIPTSKHSYLARHASEKDYINYRGEVENKSKVGHVRILNSRALREARKPIFVVEGEIDALSIIDVGGEAIGLGSAGNVKILLTMLESQKPSQPLIIDMDNDERGTRANKELTEGLERLKIPFYRIDIAQSCKDANEALNKDREAFKEAVEQAENIEAGAIEAEKEQLEKEAVLYYLSDFIENIERGKREGEDFFPTGFSTLDKILDGGLYAGLYVVGAISSLGKTTFCLQIADQVARRGQNVLIFSLEMARNELIAKTVSRLTFIKELEKQGAKTHAKTTRGILSGNYSEDERDLIVDAIGDYWEYGSNIYITEGMGDVGIDEIRSKVQKHIKLTGKAPVVVIDYLQIIAPADVRATDKQNTDKAVLELKRLSRDYSIPVIGISSFNRDNYTAPVNLASFKESGAIEYSSDVLIGLQYYGMDYQDGEKDGDRQKRIRELIKTAEQQGRSGKAQSIQVKILKNRNGSKGDTLLDFYPMFNYFKDHIERAGNSDNGEGWSKTKSNYNG